jgi:hypothetical protein
MADIKRLHYFTREFLLAQDFIDEQTYHMDMRRRHNRTSHGVGIVEGLLVTRVSNRIVQIDAGTALDDQGREIVLLSPITYQLQGTTTTLTVAIAYADVQDPADLATQGGVTDFLRTTERPIVYEPELLPSGPPNGVGVVLASIELNDQVGIATIDTNAAPRAGVTAVAAGVIGPAQLERNSVTLNAIADGAVTHDKLAPNAVEGDNIKKGTITGDKLVAGSIGFVAFEVTSQGTGSGTLTGQQTAEVLTDTLFDSTTPQFVLASLSTTTLNAKLNCVTRVVGKPGNKLAYGVAITNAAPLNTADCDFSVKVRTVALAP